MEPLVLLPPLPPRPQPRPPPPPPPPPPTTITTTTTTTKSDDFKYEPRGVSPRGVCRCIFFIKQKCIQLLFLLPPPSHDYLFVSTTLNFLATVQFFIFLM